MTQFVVIGQARDVDVGPETPLLWVLRERLDMTGTRYSCGVPVPCPGAAGVLPTACSPSKACPGAACARCSGPGLKAQPKPTVADIAKAMSHTCRWGTDQRFRAGVRRTAAIARTGKA
jgi:isoquinoline 1-oxidoreductase alpha subunit